MKVLYKRTSKEKHTQTQANNIRQKNNNTTLSHCPSLTLYIAKKLGKAALTSSPNLIIKDMQTPARSQNRTPNGPSFSLKMPLRQSNPYKKSSSKSSTKTSDFKSTNQFEHHQYAATTKDTFSATPDPKASSGAHIYNDDGNTQSIIPQIRNSAAEVLDTVQTANQVADKFYDMHNEYGLNGNYTNNYKTDRVNERLTSDYDFFRASQYHSATTRSKSMRALPLYGTPIKKPNAPQQPSLLSKAKNSAKEILNFKINAAKVLDNTQEKLRLEELKINTPKYVHIKNVSRELRSLRRYTTREFEGGESPRKSQLKPTHKKTPSASIFMKRQETKRSDSFAGAVATDESTQLYASSDRERLGHLYTMNGGDDCLDTSSPRTKRTEPESPGLRTPSQRKKDTVIEDPLVHYVRATMTNQMKAFNIPDPFDKVVKYQNINMPFSLALMAKMRKTILKEIKTSKSDLLLPPIQSPQSQTTNTTKSRRNTKSKKEQQQDNDNQPKFSNLLVSRIEDLRQTLAPQEQAKFLQNMDVSERSKRYREMKGRDIMSNYHYNYLSLNKVSKQRLKNKLQNILPANSRFIKQLES